ncbi:MAG: trigger factor [Planctomycetota bacterium]
MDFQVETLGPCRKKIAVTVPTERVREEFDRQYDEINDTLALPGFRKGHAPRKLLEKRFATHLGQEVKEKLVKAAVEELVEEKKVLPLEPPEVDLDALEIANEEPFTFEFDLLTRPEFETPAWEGIEIDVPPVEVTDEQVEEAIEGLRRREAKLERIEEAKVEDGDVLVVDWKALHGDSVEAHDENVYYPFGRGVLAGFVAEDLDEQFKGKEPGAQAECRVRVAADDPRKELRDLELEFQVVLKEIRRSVLRPVDAEFLERHDYDDSDEMRADVKKQLRRALERERDRETESRLVKRLVGGIEMSLPESFVEKDLENWARRRRVQLEMEGVPEEEITKRLDEERGDARTAVEQELREAFLLDRLAEETEVKVSEAEILQAIQAIAQAYGRPESEVLSSFKDGNRLTELAAGIRHRKVRETVRRTAHLVEKEPSETAPKSDG